MNDEAKRKLEKDTTLFYAKRLMYAADDVDDGHIQTLTALKSFIENILDMVKREMKLLHE